MFFEWVQGGCRLIYSCLFTYCFPTTPSLLTDQPPGALWEHTHQQENWFPFLLLLLLLLLLCLFCSCRVFINVIKGLLCWSFKEVTSYTWSMEESWEYNVKGIDSDIAESAQTHSPITSSACSISTSHTCSSFSAPPIACMPTFYFGMFVLCTVWCGCHYGRKTTTLMRFWGT